MSFFKIGVAVFALIYAPYAYSASGKAASGFAKIGGLVIGAASGAVAVYSAKECYATRQPLACLSAVTTLKTAMESLAGSQSAAQTESAFDNSAAGIPDCGKAENKDHWMCKGFDMPSIDTPTGSLAGTPNTNIDPGSNPLGGTGAGNVETSGKPSLCLDCSPSSVQGMINQTKDLLSKAGVQLSPDGSAVKLPDGKAGMLSDMLSAADAEKIKAAINAGVDQRTGGKLAEIMAGSSPSNIVTIPNGGSSGPSSSASEASNYDFKFPNFGQAMRKPTANGQEVFAGLAKPFGNDKIGVAGDDIFRMINRAYVRIGDKNEFLP